MWKCNHVYMVLYQNKLNELSVSQGQAVTTLIPKERAEASRVTKAGDPFHCLSGH